MASWPRRYRPPPRLEARLPHDVHALLKRAAEIEGRTLTDFVVSAAREAACRTIEATGIIRLSVEDQRQMEAGTGAIAAWYTISAASIPLVDLPPDETRRLPRYPTVPAVRIGRLAVDQRFQGRGLGTALLADAAARALKADAAAFTLLVDAKNDEAVAFYQRFGFRILTSRPRTLFLPLASAWKIFRREDEG